MAEIVIDMERITIAEYRELLDPKQEQAAEDAIIARACGITAEELTSLSQPEYRRLLKRFFAEATKPLDDPK